MSDGNWQPCWRGECRTACAYANVCTEGRYVPAPAPDQTDRGELVEALAGAVCECGHPVDNHHPSAHPHLLRPDRLEHTMPKCPCRLTRHEALVPTVEAYAQEVAREAVAGRLAGVEAVLQRWAAPMRVISRRTGKTLAQELWTGLRAALAGGDEC